MRLIAASCLLVLGCSGSGSSDITAAIERPDSGDSAVVDSGQPSQADGGAPADDASTDAGDAGGDVAELPDADPNNNLTGTWDGKPAASAFPYVYIVRYADDFPSVEVVASSAPSSAVGADGIVFRLTATNGHCSISMAEYRKSVACNASTSALKSIAGSCSFGSDQASGTGNAVFAAPVGSVDIRFGGTAIVRPTHLCQ